MNVYKKIAVWGLIFTIMSSLITTFGLNSVEASQVVDEATIEKLRVHQPDYFVKPMAATSDTTPTEEIQAFSFVNKTYQTTINQLVLLQFTSKLAVDEVLVRIPASGQVYTSYFSKGETFQHAHGEYWTLRTQGKRTAFELPVFFEAAGQYFVTIGHDADFFYLEVEQNRSILFKESENIAEVDERSVKEAQHEGNMDFVYAIESNLDISQDLLDIENERILEETRDPHDRSISNVDNWPQFLAAWNSDATSIINLTSAITDGPDTLNVRDQSIRIEFDRHHLNLFYESNVLSVTGAADLVLSSVPDNSARLIGHLRPPTRMNPAIIQSGSGRVLITNQAVIETGASLQNLSIERGSTLNNSQSYIEVSPNGCIEISNSDNRATGIFDTTIKMPGNAYVNITGSQALINRDLWDFVDLQLNGPQARNIVSAITTPDDFEVVYANSGLGNPSSKQSIGISAFNGNAPPRPLYTLSIAPNPSQGGNPTPRLGPIRQGSTTTIAANPNEGYRFVHWEIISGRGSRIADKSAETTTFTMGSERTEVRAVYEEVQFGEVHVRHVDKEGGNIVSPEVITGVIGDSYETAAKEIPNYYLFETPVNAKGFFETDPIEVIYVYGKNPVAPVDPLDPDVEVNPENKPDLPPHQDTLSIDFVSSFNFGQQAISAKERTYYAKPQRLLNADGSINEIEERPNYIQISDRRIPHLRHGWQLAVTQKEQFKTQNGFELIGARIHLANQELVSSHWNNPPSIQVPDSFELIPGHKRTLLLADENQGEGTWIYRFGDPDTLNESVGLTVPATAAVEADHYTTTFEWELSSVPGNY
ncbi:hypothetical protein A5886_000573 [Enterococcus sp. 8G7_MSG3316]|uniref:Bacterial repeat domain-containing protein n=1 Tax=Candidatus Enterococcus testudinis TaxID=1834191 RepID=A0A242A4G7_9ENTE|nr:WxL domain-containing protein [Enterococcus sp. 8G7_MSG3316]OTN75503.1 hypothetical protein A5886_000573 [Enterococcus sp. 8G7_MSG3316]